MAATAPLFRFVQLEYPGAIGPTDGRYVVRGHAGTPEHVLMLATLGAVERRGLLARRRRSAPAVPPGAPAPVATGRATLVAAAPFTDVAAADAWRADVEVEAEAEAAIRVLNRVLHVHRVATADATVRELARGAALVVRVGVGEGEALAHGRWTNAVELLPQRASRAADRSAAVLRPQERLAAVLGGRDVALAGEELTLRARSDLDAGRPREAALQLRVAVECALAELAPWSDREAIARRIDALADERGSVAAAANAAVAGGLDRETTAEVGRVLALLEAALRTRTAVGLE